MTHIFTPVVTYDETAYREKVRALAEWCQENNLSFNVNKTKELNVDFKSNQIKSKSTQIVFVTYTWLADVNASVAKCLCF